MTDADIIVIGGGHNGLACATYLAKAGRKVLLLEANEQVGGAAETREFADGFRVSGCAHFLYQLRNELVDELNLTQHGLKCSHSDLATIALAPDGQHLTIEDGNLSGPVSDRDQAGHLEFGRLMRRFAKLLAGLMGKAPPRLADMTTQDKLTLARLGLDIRRFGKADMREFLRLIAINIYDLLNEHYDSALAKGAISLDAVLGTHLGPRSPNTVFTYLHRLTGNVGPRRGAILQPAGGMGNVIDALQRAAVQAGVTIRTAARVERVLVEDGRIAGVALADGEQLTAETVVSNADPKTTVMSLVGARHFETGFVKRIHNLRANGNAAKLHLALSGAPEFTGLAAAQLKHRLVIAPDMDHVERAFNPAKYGECSPDPVMEISIPTMNDASLAPDGQHVLSATVQYAPYRLKASWDDTQREAFQDNIKRVLTRYAPDIGELVVASELLTPVDLEARYGMHGGHWHHGELTMDQALFVRPVAGAAQYALPLDGLYLCGAGAHPGGGVTGSPGRNAARAILAGGQG